MEEDKIKYFQQLLSEIEIDIEKAKIKKAHLEKQMESLTLLLEQKDRQIFDEEKAVKELLKNSINNYTHEEYLKHRQDELISKAKYLEKEIESLEEQYRVFQENFVEASKDTNDYNKKITKAINTIQTLKEKQKLLK